MLPSTAREPLLGMIMVEYWSLILIKYPPDHYAVRLDAPGALKDINSLSTFSFPSPTILFVKPEHVISLTSSILNASRSGSWLSGWGWRHKVAQAAEGFITKESLWDRLVFDAARVKVLGEGAGTLRALISSGGKSPSYWSFCGIHLLRPVLRLHPGRNFDTNAHSVLHSLRQCGW